MKDDVVDQIVNALTGACQECNGRGYTRAPRLKYTCFGPTSPLLDSAVEDTVKMCEVCNWSCAGCRKA